MEYLKFEDGIVVIDKEVEKKIDDLLAESKRISDELNKYKAEIKGFIEDNNTGSFKTDLLDVVYTRATTSTTIDTTLLKSKYANIAAECSKVGTKSSSIQVKSREKEDK